MRIIINPANENDFDVLTSIAIEAKKHWGYPETYFEIWNSELTITKDYIHKNIVNVAFYQGIAIGFYSIVKNPRDFWSGEVFVEKGYWLEHIFIKPAYHRQGTGSRLIEHAKLVSKNKGISKLLIFVDPYAKGFYDKIGARFVKESSSSIEGRMIPVYELCINT